MDDGTSIVRITKSFLFKPLAFRGLFKKQPEIFKVTVNKCMYTYIHIYIYKLIVQKFVPFKFLLLFTHVI